MKSKGNEIHCNRNKILLTLCYLKWTTIVITTSLILSTSLEIEKELCKISKMPPLSLSITSPSRSWYTSWSGLLGASLELYILRTHITLVLDFFFSLDLVLDYYTWFFSHLNDASRFTKRCLVFSRISPFIMTSFPT